MSCQVLGQPTTGPDIANMEEELKQKEKRLNAWQERLEKEKEIIFALSPEHPERGCRLQILASDKAALASAWQALVQDKERLQQEAAAARSGRSAHDAPPGDTVNTLAAVMSELAAVKVEARQGLAEATEAKRQASYVQAELIQTQHLLFVASHTSQHHSDIGQVSIGSSHTAKYQVVHPDLTRLPLAELRDNDDRVQRVCTAIARAFPQVTASGITYRVFCNMFKGGGDGDQAEQQQGDLPATSAGLGKRQGKRQRGASKGLQPAEAELLKVNGTPALTLVDLCGAMAIKQQPNGVFKEDPHMQKPTFRMLQVMAEALEWDVCMVDTHSPADQFQNPVGRPDAVGMDPKLSSKGSRRQWALVVIPFEFKLGDTASVLAEGTGQLAERSCAIFSAQLDRFLLVVVLLTMDSVEVKVFKLPFAVRNAAAAFASLSEFEYSRSGPLPLYISPESPGLQLLVRVMISTPAQLGYSERPPLPSSPGGMPLSLGGYAVTDLVLERRGTAFNGGSWVFFGTACKGQEQLPAVLKLNVQPTEADVLMLVGGRPHLAHLLAQGQCCFCGVDYAAVLLSPLATHLSEQDTLETCVQVCYDVAAALETLQGLGFLHCDPTRNNIGKCTGRGVLFDYSAAQVINAEEPGLVPDAMSAGQAGQQPAPESPTMSLLTCTGTLQFVAVEQLLGAKPRMRSQLEQLAYSMFDVMTGGQLMGRKAVAHKQAQWWVGQKYAQFAQPKPSVAKAIREDFQPFLSDLLGLFWRQPADAQAGIGRLYYPGDVTVQQFQDVCLRHMSASARECMAEERKERAQMGGP